MNSTKTFSNKAYKQQKLFIHNLSDNIFLQAVPGAGKTTSILQKIFFILKNRPKAHLQYISFNTRLAIEFQNKLHLQFPKYLNKNLIKNVRVNTIHSLLYKNYIKTHPNTLLVINSADQNLLNQSQNKMHFVTFNDIEQYFIKQPDSVKAIFKNINFLFIDEIQDFRPNLIKILLYILKTPVVINAVGDINQTIYQFAGSDTQQVLDFAKAFDTKIDLNLSHRLNKPITCLINILFNQNISTNKNVSTNNESKLMFVQLKEHKEQSKFLRLMLQKWVIEQTNIAESRITRRHRLLPVSLRGNTVAILLRSNKEVDRMHNLLTKAGLPVIKLPYLLKSEITYLMKLHTLFNELLNINSKQTKTMSNIIKEFQNSAIQITETRIPQHLIYELNNIKSVSDISLWMYKVENYLRQLPYSGTINISTIHQSKGLEFDAVIIPNFDQYDITNLQKHPELKNLLYVALTRAKLELIIISKRHSITSKSLSIILKKLRINCHPH